MSGTGVAWGDGCVAEWAGDAARCVDGTVLLVYERQEGAALLRVQVGRDGERPWRARGGVCEGLKARAVL